MNAEDSKKNVVIVGGGTAGWMVAAGLVNTYKDTIEITLVESSVVGTVGVGEATIPTIRRFYADLGFSDQDLIRETKATCKLGIQFKDWVKVGTDFFHPFGLFGQDVKGVRFHHYWLKLKRLGLAEDLADYSLGVQLARQGKCALPSPNPPSMLSIFDWALHFDAALFAQLLQKYADARGVNRIEAKITGVNLRPENGYIQDVELDSGHKVSGDLFIDCTGFQALLIEGALKTPYVDWSEWLVCDRAVALQSSGPHDYQPYTVAAASIAGWRWQIPLQHRQGNGMVYSSRFISDDEATHSLLKSISGEAISTPRKFTFKPGVRKKVWNKNCIAVGLAAGFLEPLESTSIALVETAIEKIKMFFPAGEVSEACIDEFNEMTLQEYERVRDFLILHYKATQRSDTPMWNFCREMSIPKTLEKKMSLFRERGHLLKYPWEIFQPASWLALFSGFNYLPKTYDPAVDVLDLHYLRTSLDKMRESLVASVSGQQDHRRFLRTQFGVEV